MAYVMKSADFIATAKKIATNYKTLYVMGCFGACLNKKGKARYVANNTYNKQAARVAKINVCPDDTFGFDCVGLIKGILWGWSGNQDPAKNYGGARYAATTPDLGAGEMFDKCTDVSADFTHLIPGEALRCSGHIGIYIGDGLAVEATPSWNDGVQITAVENIAKSTKYPNRTWLKHGKLPWIEYPPSRWAVGNGTRHVAIYNSKAEATAFLKGLKVYEL